MAFCIPSIFYIFLSIVTFFITYTLNFSWKIKIIALIPLLYSVLLYYVCDISAILAWLLLPVPFYILSKMMPQIKL